MPAEIPAPPLRLTLDREALVGNWRALDRLSGAARAGAAVKADGYGVGARRVVSTLAAAGCADFFVAHWSEAAEIADLVDPASISVLHGPMTATDAIYAKALGLRPVINTLAQAQCWQDAGGGPCDLMVDTGINRIGLPMAVLVDPVIQRLDLRVLMSHLASADEDSPLNEVQRRRWESGRAIGWIGRASINSSCCPLPLPPQIR